MVLIYQSKNQNLRGAVHFHPCWSCHTSAGTLVVEEDAVAGKHVIRLSVVDDDPVCIQLGHT